MRARVSASSVFTQHIDVVTREILSLNLYLVLVVLVFCVKINFVRVYASLITVVCNQKVRESATTVAIFSY